MTYSPVPSSLYSEFQQACRAFRPSELLPAIARVSAGLGEPPYPNTVSLKMPPWGLAAAARESLLHGNEHRSKPVDDKALRKLMVKFQRTADLDDGDQNFVLKMMTRLAYEQFPYQESMFEELARSHAWMVEGLSDVETTVITEDSLAAMFDGVSFHDAIGATFVLYVGALKNSGVYKRSWLDQPNFVDVLDVYPRSNIEKIASRLTTTPGEFRAKFGEQSVGTATTARFNYNPLVATPFVDMGSGDPVAPATRLILRTVTPGGLYYSGVAKHGNAFAEDLGVLFEHYVGRHLKLIPGADVVPEIVFGKGGGQKSVDWFVILPNLVILLEVKSQRLTVAGRAGDVRLIPSFEESLGHARRQLTRTVEHLAESHPAFGDIPTDRPMLAMIVTAGPFYTGAGFLSLYNESKIPGGHLPDVPVAVASARGVESLVTHGNDVEPMLLEAMQNADYAINVDQLEGNNRVDNPILSNAWNAYPWPAART